MHVQPLVHRAVGQLDNWYTFRRSPALSAPRGYLVDGRKVDAEWMDRFPSALPHRLATRAALEHGQSVAVVSRVATSQAVLLRMMLVRAQMTLDTVRRGKICDADFPRLVRASGELFQARVEFVDGEELAPQRAYGGLATALEELRRDPKWLSRASDCIVSHWRRRNARKAAGRSNSRQMEADPGANASALPGIPDAEGVPCS
jgi:DnaB-like helicase C terminal domain